MKIRRRRRQGFDEERKRQLRQDLRSYFINSKNLLNQKTTSDSNNLFGANNDSEAAIASADSVLDPQGQLERAKTSGFNFGDISILPQSKQGEGMPSSNAQEEQEQNNLEGRNQEQEQEQEQDNSSYTRYQLEQLEQQREQQDQETEKVQHLVDLPRAIESDNRDFGHSIKAFADPFLILKELLWMSGKQNPELEVIQRLWLVWTKWYTYYDAWYSVNREESRFLPGSNRVLFGDSQQRTYQYRGIHELETHYLESSILQVMRWEFARKSELERQFSPMPTLSQLHGYFVGLNRRYWNNSSWQYRVNLGTQLTMQEEDDELLNFSTEE